jgi:hypothetical protein
MKTITISEENLKNLLIDNDRLQNQVTDLQNRSNELLDQVRELKATGQSEDNTNIVSKNLALVKKADLCVKVISLLMTTCKNDKDQLIEDLSVELMNLPEKNIQEMYGLLTMESAFPSYDSGLEQYEFDTRKMKKESMNRDHQEEKDDPFPDYSERGRGR